MVRRAGRRGEQGDGLATRLLRAPVHRARSGDRSGAGRARRSVRRAAASVTMALALALALVAALLATSAATVGAATVGTPSASPQPPTQDPFYVWSGSLSTVPPGTVLRSRAVSVPYLSSVPVTATQLLYRTTNELGQPAVTVTTVLQPVGASPTKLVSWQMFYDALGAQCDPSYEMQGGGGIGGAQEEEQLMTPYLDAGDTVTVPDYEGENLAWLAGQQSGYQTLDGIRATEQWLHMAPATTPVALIGYSGGSVATQWAAEMAPAYAPELHIVGSAAGGVPVDPAHNLTYLEGGNDPSSSSWDGVIPAVLVGTAERGFGVDLTPYLSAYGQEVANQVSDECINSFAGDYPGLTMAQLLKPQYQDFLSVPIFASVVNELTMGTDGTPTSPMFLAVGNADGTGDGVMVAGDVEALAHLYCERGVPVQFDEYNGLSHVLAAVPFEATALSLITAWLAGAPTPDNCTTIGTGNSLAPLAAGTAPPASPAGAASSATATSVEPAGTTSAVDGAVTVTGDGVGAFTVATYPTDVDPELAVPGGSTGQYFDVRTAVGSTFSSLTVDACSAGTGTSLDWWNPAADSGTGAWQPVSTADAAGARCTDATVTNGSSPSLSQPAGTVFAVVVAAPPGQQPPPSPGQ